ncbi:MAG: hypothetical protein AAFO91_18845, partial [Bacteroidota bacterium]
NLHQSFVKNALLLISFSFSINLIESRAAQKLENLYKLMIKFLVYASRFTPLNRFVPCMIIDQL